MSMASYHPVAEPPLGMLAELTHRCPLQCPYCSNPVALERGSRELDTATWQRVLSEAAALGVLQVHYSGGEPTARRDLVEIVRHGSAAGLYGNLITSGVLMDAALMGALTDAGLEHVQLSIQDSDFASGDVIAGYVGAHVKKSATAALVKEAGLPLTVNAVVHRRNVDRLPAMIELALAWGAGRIEVAHVQYYGWALENRRTLLPTRDQLERATETVLAARERLKGRLVIDYVVPDYYAERPKACMGGWGRQFLNVSPSGKVLPCHAAESLTGFAFPNVATTSLADAWSNSEAFNRYRGTAWMPEPCRSCDRREIDFGGCRCQAFALTGDAGATDPACGKSADHGLLDLALADAAASGDARWIYRRIGALAG